jgi:hypothetical protein
LGALKTLARDAKNLKTNARKADLFRFVERQGRVSLWRDKLFARDCSSTTK